MRSETRRDSATDKNDIDQLIEQARADWNAVGVAVAVVRGDEVVYERGFGVKEVGKPAKIDAHTLFQIGSTSKAFTTAALGMLVDEGKVRWDDPVIDHLPDFQLQDPWLTRQLTLRDTVTHRSGILGSVYFALGIMDLDEAVRQLRYAAPEAPFRDSHLYSNLMYGLAGKVVHAASGLSWQDFVRQRLLEPLRMSRSGTSPYEFWDARHVAPTYLGSAPSGRSSFSDSRDSNVAMPHWQCKRGAMEVLPWQSYDNAAAAGAIISSAADMANWVILNLNGGRFGDRQLLKEGTQRELHSPQNLHTDPSHFLFDQAGATYAMGWRRAWHRGHTYLAHGGGIMGFPAYVALLPEQRMGVVVLSNGSQPAWLGFNTAIALGVFDCLLGVSLHAWSGELLAREQKVQQEGRQLEDKLRQSRLVDVRASLPLEHYTGSYEDIKVRSGSVEVRLENGGLMLCFAGEGAFAAHLEHWHQDVFRLRSNIAVSDVLGPQFATFHLDPFGNVISMAAFGPHGGTLVRKS